MTPLKLAMIAAVTCVSTLATVTFWSDAVAGDAVDMVSAQQLFVANNDPSYLATHKERIQAFIAHYQPANDARDLAIAYYAFGVADLASAQVFCANFDALEGPNIAFGDQALLDCFGRIYNNLLVKSRAGEITFSPMELALLHDEAYGLNGNPELLTPSTIQDFSFDRATALVRSDPGALDDQRVLRAFANSAVCNGRDLETPPPHRVFSLCYDPVDYREELEKNEFIDFSFVHEAIKACSTLPRRDGHRCIARLQEHFQIYGQCTIPVHLMGGEPQEAAARLREEIAKCYALKLK